MKIAIQGERGSFSHEAASKMVEHCKVVPCRRSSEVFDLLEKDEVPAAIIPIENTLAGSVAEHYDLLLKHDFFIHQEFRLRIVHNLIASHKVTLEKVKKIFSHPIALEQCRKFLNKLPDVEIIPYYDTAGSVRHVVEEELLDSAAIASELAAEEYKGQVLERGIEDNKNNFTRFFLLKKSCRIEKNANKTSLVFALKNVPGVLYKALSIFAMDEINLSKIESRPVPGKPWEYIFYIDVMQGNTKTLKKALKNLKKTSSFVKLLGIYPAAK